MKIIFLIAIFVTLASSCNYNPNNLELITASPRLVSSTQNGQKLIIGDENSPGRNFLYVANLKGTPYEMGKAFGQLFQKELKQQLTTFFDYYQGVFAKFIQQKAPKFIAPFLQKNSIKTLKTLLYLNVLITKKYTNPRYYQEIKGIADAIKSSQKQIAMLNILPELVKAACTVAGVWGPAAKNSHTLHMRALDWDAQNPINKFPLVAIYHPSNSSLQTHANIGWVGFVGSLTGISKKVSLGQKVWLPPKHSVAMTRYGNPWNYVFRDILYEATNLQTAIQMLQKTQRTCAIHIGLGSVEDKSFRMMQYSYKILNVYDDKNYNHYSEASHPKRPGIAYFDKHVQPSSDPCVGQLLTNSSYYGKWTMESFWRVVGQSHQTGNTQLVVFDLNTLQGLISYSQYHGKGQGYNRPPIYVNFQELFTDF